MDDKDLISGAIGTVGKWDIALVGNKLVAKLDASHPLGSAGLVIELDAGAVAKLVLEKVKAAIPGQLDDAIINGIEAALKI